MQNDSHKAEEYRKTGRNIQTKSIGRGIIKDELGIGGADGTLQSTYNLMGCHTICDSSLPECIECGLQKVRKAIQVRKHYQWSDVRRMEVQMIQINVHHVPKKGELHYKSKSQFETGVQTKKVHPINF